MDIFDWHVLFTLISGAAGLVGALIVMAVPVRWRWRIRPDTLLVLVFLLATAWLIGAEITGNRPSPVTFPGWFTGERGKVIGVTMFGIISISLIAFLYWAMNSKPRRVRQPRSHYPVHLSRA